MNSTLRTITLFFSLLLFTFFHPLALIAEAATEEEPIDLQLRREIEIGRRAVAQIEEHWELVADPVRLARLTMIAERLRPHLERDIPYEVRIIRSDVPNAFCLPGGFIFFTSGMLDFLRSDSEIAAVMAHEMAHVDLRHGMQMAARANRVNLAALATIVLSGGALAPVVLAQVAQIAITSSYSIEFEKEADSVGLDVLIAAGFHPSAMVTVMERLMHEEMKRPIRELGIYRTHPEYVVRIQRLTEQLRSMRIPLERKLPLQLLRTSIQEDGRYARLMMDDTEVWGGKKDAPTLELLEHVQILLDRYFQMELAPHDLRLEGDGENHGLLRLKNNVLVEMPLPTGMPDLATFRGNLMAALARAQVRHPVARFLR